MPIDIIIAIDVVTTLRGSINCSTVICSPTVYLLSWEKPLVNTTAPGSIHIHRLHLCFYFALLLCCFQFSLGKQCIRDWQPLHSVVSKLFVFVQVLVIFLHWIDTLVLKTEGNTYRRCATSPFPLRGNTNARLQGHGGNPLHTWLGSPLRRSRSWRIPGAVDTTIFGAVARDTQQTSEVFLAPLSGRINQDLSK